VLVRDDFRGKTLVNAIIDLPFALPTIVAGLTLLALYGPRSPVGINVAYTRTAIVLALLFVTLPFVVRTVQPVLEELDVEMEQAAASLGASELTTFRRIVFPNILPGILSGVALALAKAVGEFGSLVIITGNLPYKTEVSSVYIFGRIESGDSASAAAVAVVRARQPGGDTASCGPSNSLGVVEVDSGNRQPGCPRPENRALRGRDRESARVQALIARRHAALRTRYRTRQGAGRIPAS